VIIDAELGREDSGSIPATTIGRGPELLNARKGHIKNNNFDEII
jgi:hypothetical protein